MINDALLDRLVDGELADDERRHLLATLDHTPAGWRRCALAFLESQTLRQGLGGLLDETRAASAGNVLASTGTTRSARSVKQSFPWATAAAVLIAFGFGMAIRGLPTAADPPLANLAPPVTDEPRLDESLLVWAADDQGARRAIRTPLLDADAMQQQFGVRLDASPSPDVLRRFEEQGFRLSTKRRFAPLFIGGGASGGGRPIVVPVDDVRVAPIRYVAL